MIKNSEIIKEKPFGILISLKKIIDEKTSDQEILNELEVKPTIQKRLYSYVDVIKAIIAIYTLINLIISRLTPS